MSSDLLRVLNPVCSDSAGVLYGLVPDSHADKDLAGTLVLCDLRSELVDKHAAQAAPSTTLTDVQPTTVMHLQPPLSFDPVSMQVAPSGRFLVITGVDREDGDQSVVVVVDLHSSQPYDLSRAGSLSPQWTPGGRKRGGTPGPATDKSKDGEPAVRHRTSYTHLVDYSLFASRSGLAVRQVGWHPHSESHLLLLTSDSRLRMYHLNNLTTPELTVHVQCGGASRGGGVRYGLSASATAGEEAVAFSWGSSTGWGPLTLYLLSSVGAVYALCPFTAVGQRCSSESVAQGVRSSLASAGDDPGGGLTAHQVSVWLSETFGVGGLEELTEQAVVTVGPRSEQCPVPTLQGPLNAGSASLAPADTEACTLTALHHQHLPTSAVPLSSTPTTARASSSPALHTTTVLVSGRQDGQLFFHVLLESVGPRLVESEGLVRADRGPEGTVTGVRYTCPEEAAGSSRDLGVLLDQVTLLGGQLNNYQTQEDDYEDPTSQTHLPLTLATLSSTASCTVVAGHARGCWAVDVPWLPMVSRQLALAQQGAEGDALLDMGELPPPVVCELLLAGRGEEEGEPGAGGDELRSVSCVQDVFVGRVVLVVQEPGVLHCIRPGALLAAAEGLLSAATPAPAQTLGEGQGGAVSTSDAGQKGTEGAGAGPGTSKGDSTTKTIEATIQSVYADLVTAPPAPKVPTFTESSASDPVEAATLLTSAVRALRQGAVECVHRTHTGLAARAVLLDQEAKAQQASVTELTALMSKVEERQQELSKRAERALQLHNNLVERAGILTQLHWSLPRPMSEAELQFSAELDVATSRQQALDNSWRHVSTRATSALNTARDSQSSGAPSPPPSSMARSPVTSAGSWFKSAGGVGRSYGLTPARVAASGARTAGSKAQQTAVRVPEAQMAPLQDVLKEHLAAIGLCMGEVERLQQEMRAWEQQSQCREAVATLNGIS